MKRKLLNISFNYKRNQNKLKSENKIKQKVLSKKKNLRNWKDKLN